MNTTDAHALYFPGDDWQTITPAEAGWDEQALDDAMREAHDFYTTGVVMLEDGKIVAERYWELPDDLASISPRLARAGETMLHGRTEAGYPLEDVASAQKSVVAVLAAIAKERGLIDYDDALARYLGDDWADVTPDQSRAITLRHVMTMTSGLDESLRFQAEPGTVWRYNTAAYQNILRVLSAASGMDANTLTRQWLTGPIGMHDTAWVEREWARQDPPMMGLVTTPRDMARFGLLVLAGGRWQDRQVVPAAAMRELLKPGQQLNPAYGMLWWLNNGQGYLTPRSQELTPGKRVPAAPADMLTAAGALNRYVFVLPTQHAVIVRTGLVNPDSDMAEDGFDAVWWQALSRIFPDSR